MILLAYSVSCTLTATAPATVLQCWIHTIAYIFHAKGNAMETNNQLHEIKMDTN